MPQEVLLRYWIPTVGIGIVGTFAMSIQWVDIDGVSRSIPGNALGLLNLNSLFGLPASLIRRQSDSSAVNLVSTLAGLALGAEISYLLLIGSGSTEGHQVI